MNHELLFSKNPAAGGYTIDRSLRFNSADSAYLSRTPASAGNRKTWTLSFWYKAALQNTTRRHIFTARDGSGNHAVVNLRGSDDKLEIYYYNGSLAFQLLSTAVFRDPSAWYHFAIAYDTTQATASNRVKAYVNGSEITTFDTASYPTQDYADALWNSTNAHAVGREDTAYLSGYLADVYLIDGSALDPTSFGEFDTNGVWQPIAYSGSYGTNGFHLDFADNSSAAALGYDAAGSNDWTVNNITADNPTTLPAVAFDGSGDYLSLASSADFEFGTGDFTVEAFVYPTTTSTNGMILASGDGGVNGQWYLWSNGGTWNFGTYVSNIPGNRIIGGAITANAWTHLAVVKSGNDFKLYINGTQSGSTYTGSGSYGPSGYTLSIGRQGTAGNDFTGFISNVRVIKGTAFYTSNFTRPSAPLSAVTNTKLLCCQSSSSTTAAAVSPGTITANGNVYATTLTDSQPGNDSLRDSPTASGTDTGAGGEVRGNYATLNPLDVIASTYTFSNGNLEESFSSATLDAKARGTVAVKSGKYYFEVTLTARGNTPSYLGFGVTVTTDALTAGGIYYFDSGVIYTDYNGNTTTTKATFAVNDVIGVAFDCDAGSVSFYKNNTLQHTVTGLSLANYCPGVFSNGGTGRTHTAAFNFGQRPFAYTAPSGFKALCTTNLPTPTIEDPSTVMDVALYTGNGSTQTISGLGFSPDLVWIKSRSGAFNHRLVDQVQGNTSTLASNLTTAAVDCSSDFTGFTSTGFSLSQTASFELNNASHTYVAWTWDAGSSTVTNTSGSISSQVRANASAGFSIVTWTGPGSGSYTVGHGCNTKPGFVIVKARNTTRDWYVSHSALNESTSPNGWSEFLNLNKTDAKTPGTYDIFRPHTSSILTLGSNAEISSANTYVAYCFAPVAGYSAFGSYTGNGSTDGPFVYTGFRPRWVLSKRTDQAGWSWLLWDSTRDPINQVFNYLRPDLSNAETPATNNAIDFLSNGFKMRQTDGNTNGSGGTFVWAAFAEHPFQTARAR